MDRRNCTSDSWKVFLSDCIGCSTTCMKLSRMKSSRNFAWETFLNDTCCRAPRAQCRPESKNTRENDGLVPVEPTCSILVICMYVVKGQTNLWRKRAFVPEACRSQIRPQKRTIGQSNAPMSSFPLNSGGRERRCTSRPIWTFRRCIRAYNTRINDILVS